MLRLTAPSAQAQPIQRGAEESRAGSNEPQDDGFSRALERRMNTAERAPARPERERPQERTAQVPERPRGEAPGETRRSTESREPARENETADAEAPVESPSPESAAADSGAQDGNTPQDNAQEANPAAQAANLAALMPGVAALPTAPATSAGDGLLTSDALLDDAPKLKSGAFTLGQLIAEATTGKAATEDKPAVEAGIEAGTTGKAKVELAADTPPPAFGARLQMAAGQPSAPPAPGLQALQPDAQAAGLHASAFAPGTARTEQPQLPQLPVHTPAGQRAWAEDVGNRMMWMVGRHESKAELVLTPAHLGKLEVSIQISGDHTTAHFVASSAAARDALEQAMPRLREVLQQAGINLGQTNVSTQSDQRAQQDTGTGSGHRQRGAIAGEHATDTHIAPLAPASWPRTGLGMVDTFA
ncbi:flagellar hook-length control protein FliK [Aromatoleum toluvorans]|uniref:Flagellar hook-length control protein FliK n=2 Tax=Aromatoleum toluvorans TaxID=92002 RepID=A0ABX1Q2G1_9RHOO|nr:flagellar hook-length control protein FliK [Aromatoleum toluvorans]